MAALFPLKVITPYGMFFDGQVRIVNTKTPKGRLGIMKGHIPLIANIEISSMDFTDSNDVKHDLVIGGGLLFVEKDMTTIITDSIMDIKDINLQKALREKEEAEKLLLQKLDVVEQEKARIQLQRAINAISAKKESKN